MKMNTVKINERTWRIEDDGVRFFLLCGTDRAALVDTGMNTRDARKIAEGLTDLPLILINTHADIDHISGNAAFEEIYMSPAEEDHYRESGGLGKVIPVKENDVIDLGGRPLRIIDIPGHTNGSIAILDESSRVMISGDTVQDGIIFMFGEQRDMGKYCASLRHLKEFAGRYDEIYPMHGTLSVKPDLIDKLLDGAGQIIRGEAVGKTTERFGEKVLLYQFPYAGFLCDAKEAE